MYAEANDGISRRFCIEVIEDKTNFEKLDGLGALYSPREPLPAAREDPEDPDSGSKYKMGPAIPALPCHWKGKPAVLDWCHGGRLLEHEWSEGLRKSEEGDDYYIEREENSENSGFYYYTGF